MPLLYWPRKSNSINAWCPLSVLLEIASLCQCFMKPYCVFSFLDSPLCLPFFEIKDCVLSPTTSLVAKNSWMEGEENLILGHGNEGFCLGLWDRFAQKMLATRWISWYKIIIPRCLYTSPLVTEVSVSCLHFWPVLCSQAQANMEGFSLHSFRNCIIITISKL